MVRLHVRDEGLLNVRLFALSWAAGAFAMAIVTHVDDESPSQLLVAGMVVGLQMLVELDAGVERLPLVKRHGRIAPATNARQVLVFGSEELGFYSGGDFVGCFFI
jgi:hypothetical protein